MSVQNTLYYPNTNTQIFFYRPLKLLQQTEIYKKIYILQECKEV